MKKRRKISRKRVNLITEHGNFFGGNNYKAKNLKKYLETKNLKSLDNNFGRWYKEDICHCL